MPAVLPDDVKPPPSRQLGIDRSAPLGFGLRSLLLFDDRRLNDLAHPRRSGARQGVITTSRGSRGGQAFSAITGLSGPTFQPCLILSPAETAVSTFSLSALVRFNGQAPRSATGVGACLAADGSGRSPLFVSGVAGTFRTRVPAETQFLSGGSSLTAASLTGWHRLTVTVDGSTTTLYVDGGTWTGTAAQAFANFGLRSLLGSDITAGYEWLWPIADFFFWARTLTADEVANHARYPYAVVRNRIADERWIAATIPPVEALVGNPFSSVFSDEFGPGQTNALEAALGGGGTLRANATMRLRGSAQIDAGPFPHFGGDVRSYVRATIGGAGTLSAQATIATRGVIYGDARLDGAGTLRPVLAALRAPASTRFSADGAFAGYLRTNWFGLTAQRGAGALSASASIALPANQAQWGQTATGTLRASATIQAGGPTRMATLSGQGSLLAIAITKDAPRMKINAYGRLRARATVRKRPRPRPGMARGSEPEIVAVEIDTYVPGNVAIVADKGHGVKPHGTLSRAPLNQLENTSMIRASDIGYRSAPADLGGPIAYPPLVNDAYQIDVALTLEPTRTSAAAAWGSVLLANANRQFDNIIGVQNSDGRGVRLLAARKSWDDDRQYLTDPPYAQFTNLFTGLATPWSLTDDGLQVPLRDVTYYLEKPLQVDTYGGTGGQDGTPDLAGKPKPMARGGWSTNPIQNITPILIDPAYLIYQYTDGPGQIINIYEGGWADATNGIRPDPTPDTTSLWAGSVQAGRYRTDNSRGLFRLGSTPVMQITADVTGSFYQGGLTYHPFQICRLLLLEDMQVPEELIDWQSFQNLQNLYSSYMAGVYFSSDEQWTCVQAIDSVLASLGANLVPTRNGQLRLVLLRAIKDTEPVAASYDENQIVALTRRPLPSTVDPPSYRWRIGWNHNYTIQTSGLSGSTSTARKQFIASADRFGSWYDPTLLTAYRRPNDFPPMPGPLLTQAAAQEVANELGALWSKPRRLYDVTLPRRYWGHEIGDVVHVRYPIEQLTQGHNGRVVGYSLRATDATVVYTVLV